MALAKDPEHPSETDMLPEDRERARGARRRQAIAEQRDRQGVIPEERHSEKLGEEQDALQHEMWGNRSAGGLNIEVSNEFQSRRLFRWLDLE